ncbi:MAG: hypothetical protein JNL76_00720 [Alphaproteobacteria bacterium]|nr:hypothetical protein [Alphaproteobacteria bacterium]
MTGTILGFLKRTFNFSITNPPAEERTYDITSLEQLQKILELRTDDPVYNGPWTVGINRSNGAPRELCLTRRDDNVQALETLQSDLYSENINSRIVFLAAKPDRQPAIKVYGNDARTLIDLLRASNGWLLEYGQEDSPLKALTLIKGFTENLGIPTEEGVDAAIATALLSPRLRTH